jgi:hypothetical protein
MPLRPTLALLTLSALVALACRRAPEPTADRGQTKPDASVAVAASAEPAPAPSSSDRPRTYGVRNTEDEFARPRPPNDNPSVVRVSHVLVAYKGAEKAGPNVTRTKEEALARAKEVGLDARVGTPFEDLVKKFSDDPTAAQNKGDLGKIGKDKLPKALTDAAFHLFVNETQSEPVETPEGFHVLRRTE